MFKVEISGVFRGNFSSSMEAMAYIEKHARPYSANWKILDQYGKVFAQG